VENPAFLESRTTECDPRYGHATQSGFFIADFRPAIKKEGVCYPQSMYKGAPAMSHHLNLLRTIFQDPVSGNIHWREIESLLHHLGATVEPSHGARFRVVLNNVEGILHHPRHSSVCIKQDIKQLREYLIQAGVSPSLSESEKAKK
jgi:hypothetical protein